MLASAGEATANPGKAMQLQRRSRRNFRLVLAISSSKVFLLPGTLNVSFEVVKSAVYSDSTGRILPLYYNGYSNELNKASL